MQPAAGEVQKSNPCHRSSLDPLPARWLARFMHAAKVVMFYSRFVGLRLKFSSWWNNFKLKSSNPLVRSKAVGSLSGSTNSRDTETILASLHDKSARVRCVALRALEKKSNPPKALKSVVKALSDPSAEVREAAARVLG